MPGRVRYPYDAPDGRGTREPDRFLPESYLRLDARAGSPPTAFGIFRRHGHDGGMEAVRDASALAMAGMEGAIERQARLAFAIARHAVADLAMEDKHC